MTPVPTGLRVAYAAEVIVDLAGGGRRRGSGYLIAPRKVLTAGHVVRDAAEVRVRFDADRPGETAAAASVIWSHPGIDVAVLAVPDAPPAEPAEFGGVGERDAVIHTGAVGFPSFKMRTAPDGSRYRDVEHAHATCAVLSNRREGTLDLRVLPPDPVEEGSPWAGMSGAAVFSGGRIVGTVARHHLSDGPGRLAASRVDRWSEQLTESELAALEIVLGVGLRPADLADVVPPHHREATLAAFTAYLQGLAPDELLDRQGELEQLIVFCAGSDPYQWIQGAPWAGKTALTSWLALHPPHGIVPVWFFVTNRDAGNADSPAYVESLIEQCAALADRDPVGGAAPAARAGELRRLLTEAADRVAARGGTLLLIVDGLDEDRSTGASIASLLPSSPPDHVRVLVTSRPHPGLPMDVDPEHPLQSCPVLRLEPSPAARNIQHQAALEMDEALRGDELTREVIGLVAAARGSLTVQDFQELTERPEFELRQRIGGPLGRILRRSERGYAFAHDTLLVAAQDALGNEVREYDARINTWADGYKAQGWPAGTPDYLLTGYAHQVAALGDRDGAVQLAVDSRRMERIRESVGIGPILAESASLASATDDEEHLTALARARVRVMELAVHGVDETSPERILNDPRVELVAGDRTAGIYRRVDDRDAAGGPVTENYAWSNLALGNAARALWLLSLPFIAINLAHWAKPDGGRSTLRRAYDVLVRLLGLGLTVLLAGVVCEVALDLVAWQCAAQASCARGKPWPTFRALDGGAWFDPGPRLAVWAVVPAGAVALLSSLSRRSGTPRESASPPPQRERTEEEVDAPWRSTMESPGFWHGSGFTASLRSAHTAASVLTVTTPLVAAALRYDRSAYGDGVLLACGWALAATLTVGWLTVIGVVARRGRSERKLEPRSDPRRVARALPVAAWVQFALAVLYVSRARPEWRASGRLPGVDALDHVVVALWLLTAALALVAGRLFHARPQAVALNGRAGPAFAAVACALAVGFAGGATVWTADWLAPGDAAGTGKIAGPPVTLAWHAALLPLIAVLCVALAVLAARRQSVLRKSLAAQVVVEHVGELYQVAEPSDLPRTRAIAAATARARLTDSTPALLGATAAAVALLGAAATVGALTTQALPGGATGPLSEAAGTVQTMGTWLVALLLALLLTMSWRAYRDPAARRTIGLFWDICTFWPRASHPLAPPSYAERAISDLSWRMSTSLRKNGGGMVLRGHGQGSVLIAAALWQLSPRDRHRICLLTCGSPLSRIHRRWFPAYFGVIHLRALYTDLDVWRNGWRPTDPIGGPIAIPPQWGEKVPDFGPLRDPARFGRSAEDPLPAPILGHLDYQLDPRVQEELSLLHAHVERRSPPPPALG
ncbi:trypsin-like peptidase domain-containing protein [Streptomyces sp.]|uniref:trypsin-like peptidase domain-containing protein n=1 Tax=Streptomyces sp. TaxID=1931 RepID=UPI002F93126A